MKADKIEELATDLAKVLKYNPELVNDPDRFDELVKAIEIRMLNVYVQVCGSEKEEPESKPGVTLVPMPPTIPRIPLG